MKHFNGAPVPRDVYLLGDPCASQLSKDIACFDFFAAIYDCLRCGRALAAAIVRGEKIDTANIMEGRRRRTTVDYVKLNEAVFG